jgi:hypothetical protein
MPTTDTAKLTYLGRADASRILAFGGVVLVVAGMLLGEIYAIFIAHVANGIIRQHWLAIVDAAINGDLKTMTDAFVVIAELTETRGRTMNTHSHMAAFGVLALVLAYLQPSLRLGPTATRRLAVVYLVGATLQAGGVYLSQYLAGWILYLSDFGAVLVIGAIATTLWAIWPATARSTPWRDHLHAHLATPASRYLVKSGLLLILLGMVFGLYYAWRLVSVDEPAVYAAMDGAIREVLANNPAAGQSEILGFKGLQSKIAITAAAHSHAIEFGFLMLLLALVQRYVLLSERWQLRWAQLLSIGAYLLPVCVYLATLYGLRAAAFADLSGGLVVLGLAAMAVGMIRFTGAVDAGTGARSP